MSIIPERLELLPQAVVVAGHGSGVDACGVPHGCAVELWAWLRGLPWSDRPACVDRRLGRLVRLVNDHLNPVERADFARRIAVADLSSGATCDRLLGRLGAVLEPDVSSSSSDWSAFARRVLEELGA